MALARATLLTYARARSVRTHSLAYLLTYSLTRLLARLLADVLTRSIADVLTWAGCGTPTSTGHRTDVLRRAEGCAHALYVRTSTTLLRRADSELLIRALTEHLIRELIVLAPSHLLDRPLLLTPGPHPT